jgi:hypothetical protein
MIILVGVLITGIFMAGAKTSQLALSWVFRRLQSGDIGDWTTPVLLLFYGWTGIIGVLGFLLSLPIVSGTGRRLSALVDHSAWELWEVYRRPIQETLRRDETPHAYVKVDDPRVSAPILLERLYLLFMFLGHALALGAIVQFLATDPYLASRLWMRYSLAIGLANLVAAGWCGTSFGFASALLATTLLFQITLGVLDPALTGPGVGLPPGCLSLFLIALSILGLYLNGRSFPQESLLVVTNRGLRRVHLEEAQVTAWQKADAPLLLVATPIAAGVRLQVGSQDGRDKLRPFRLSGDGAGALVRAELQTQDLKAELQGSDESSGIAGHLGQIPLLGWALLPALIGLTHFTLLPPQISRLQVETIFMTYREEWLNERPANLDAALTRLLEKDQDLGPALMTRAQILADKDQEEKARKLLDRLLTRRVPWQKHHLVTQAKALLKELAP